MGLWLECGKGICFASRQIVGSTPIRSTISPTNANNGNVELAVLAYASLEIKQVVERQREARQATRPLISTTEMWAPRFVLCSVSNEEKSWSKRCPKVRRPL